MCWALAIPVKEIRLLFPVTLAKLRISAQESIDQGEPAVSYR